jgi:hypothetical protein
MGPFGCCSALVWVHSGDDGTTPPVTRLLSGSSRPHARVDLGLCDTAPTATRRHSRARTAVAAVGRGDGFVHHCRVPCHDLYCRIGGSSTERRGRPDLRQNDASQGRRGGCGRRFAVSQVSALLFSASSVDLVVHRCTPVPVPIALGEDCSPDSKIPEIRALPCLRACSASVVLPVLFQQRRLAVLLSFAIAPMPLLSTTYMESLHWCWGEGEDATLRSKPSPVSLHQRRRRLADSTLRPTRQRTKTYGEVAPSRGVAQHEGPRAIRPIITGPALSLRITGLNCKGFSVITVCNPALMGIFRGGPRHLRAHASLILDVGHSDTYKYPRTVPLRG